MVVDKLFWLDKSPIGVSVWISLACGEKKKLENNVQNASKSNEL